MKKPWTSIPISDIGEEMHDLPNSLNRIEPHPYSSKGAPYGKCSSPWRLRSSVINRLLIAQEFLSSVEPGLNLSIFDAWRPIRVQAFMIEYVINIECKKRGISRVDINHQKELKKLISEISKYWASPSLDKNTPPPHSTGGAVDLTVCDANGILLSMGGEIDEISELSHPQYYLNKSTNNPQHVLWNKRRSILSTAMRKAEFIQHPNEWWHFSYGDQLWAWKKNLPEAIYGSVDK